MRRKCPGVVSYRIWNVGEISKWKYKRFWLHLGCVLSVGMSLCTVGISCQSKPPSLSSRQELHVFVTWCSPLAIMQTINNILLFLFAFSTHLTIVSLSDVMCLASLPSLLVHDWFSFFGSLSGGKK